MSARTVDVPDLVDYLDHFQRRVLADALAEGTRAYWLRRAEQLEAARPQAGDFHGQTTLEQRREQWRRLTAMAKACRARAQVALLSEVEEVASWHAA